MAKRKTPKKKPAANAKADFPWIVEGLRPLAEPLDKLTLDPANARKHDDGNIRAIAGSLKQFGQRVVLVANRANGQIEKGNGTYLAAKQLGYTHLAVVWVEDDAAAQTGFSIADNRTAELAVWDETLLQEALLTIEESTPDLYSELLLDSLRAEDPEDPTPAGEQPVPASYEIIIECKNRRQQQVTFQRLKKDGHKCRLPTS